MKKLLFYFLFHVLISFEASAQITEAQKRQTALVVKEAVVNFQTSLGSLVSRPPKSQDINERRNATSEMGTYITPSCRIQNDLLLQGQKGSSVLDFQEYFKILPSFYPEGLMYDLDLSNAEFSNEFRNTAQGYLVDIYAKKNLSGTNRSGQELQLDNVPCRIGVYVNALGNSAKGCKIGYIDTDMSKKGKTFSLKDGNPLDFQTLDETLETVAKQLTEVVKQKGLKKLQVTTFTYDNQEVIDDFSIKVTTSFRNKLTKLNPTLEITSPSRSWDDQPTIKGGYKVKGNFVEFVAQLQDDKKTPLGNPVMDKILHKNLAPSDDVVPDIAPVEIESASEVKKTMDSRNTVLPSLTTLKFELATNRGINSLVFVENDTMRLAVRASKECYVRLIYRQMDNKLVLLRNKDFKIKEYELNKWIEIPEDFRCTPPFGVEFLIAYASTEPFENLKTHEEGGNVIIDNSLAETKKISVSRGMTNKGIPVIEKVLQITTKVAK